MSSILTPAAARVRLRGPLLRRPGASWALAVHALIVASALVLEPAAGTAAASRPPKAKTAEGRVIGQTIDGIARFLGVPYAAPPVGALRWQAPVPPPRHPPLLATRFRLPCGQIPLPEGSDSLGRGKRIESSEDCLYLNVWVPADAKGVLPVMVWLHGGQYLRGSSSQYIGDRLAREGQVVVVTMDYRLGPLGFLAHPALTATSPLHTSGNQTLFDHLQALQWLRKNVRAFHGDPRRITLFGQSAGSASICALMTSPLAKGLFQRVILQSDPCPGSEDIPTLKDREPLGRRLAAALGCENADLNQELGCMRSKSMDDVLNAIPLAKVLGESGNGVGYRYNIDHVVLAEAPAEAVAGGRFTHIPVMLGTTDNEMGRYVGGYGVTTVDQYRAHVTKEWPAQALALLELYPATSDAAVPEQMARLYSDWAMTCGVRRDARAFARAGQNTFVYRFTHAPQLTGRNLGAFHGAELFYLFPEGLFARLPGSYGEADRQLTAILAGYWARFAATGDPNGSGAVRWPAYTTQTEPYLQLDLESRADVQLHHDACDVWDRLAKAATH